MEKNVVVIDIETVPSNTMPPLDDLTPPANMSKPETIERWKKENQIEVWKKQALNSMKGQIACIGMFNEGFYDDCIGDNEELLMVALNGALIKLKNMIREPLHFTGWNITAFDIPWLWRKSIQYNLPELRKIIPHGNRFLQTDLMKVWAGDYKDYVSLDNCAKFLGIDHEGGSGRDVFDWWRSGDYDSISEHCRQDLITTMKIYERIYG